MSGTPIARLVPVGSSRSVLGRMAAEGRLTAPTAVGPIPLPPPLGDPGVDAATELVMMRYSDR